MLIYFEAEFFVKIDTPPKSNSLLSPLAHFRNVSGPFLVTYSFQKRLSSF